MTGTGTHSCQPHSHTDSTKMSFDLHNTQDRVYLVWNEIERVLQLLFPKSITAFSTLEKLAHPPQCRRIACLRHIPNLRKRIETYVSRYYITTLLPCLRPLTGLQLLSALEIKWNTCLHNTSLYLANFLRALTKPCMNCVDGCPTVAYSLVKVKTLVQNLFRVCIYRELAQELCESAYKTIERDSKRTERSDLARILSFIISISLNSEEFYKDEWDSKVMIKIMFKMPDVVSSWRQHSIPQFLDSYEQRTKDYNSLLFLTETKQFVGTKFLNAVRRTRDMILFHKDGSDLNEMLQRDDRLSDLTRLFVLFKSDGTLFSFMAKHFELYFRYLIFGDVTKPGLNILCQESFLKKVLKVWKRIDLVRCFVFRKQEVHDAIIMPFMRVLLKPTEGTNFNVPLQILMANYIIDLAFMPHLCGIEDSAEDVRKTLSLVNILPYSEEFGISCQKRMEIQLLEGLSPDYSTLRVLLDYSVINLEYKHPLVLMLADVWNWRIFVDRIGLFMEQFGPRKSTIVETHLVNRKNWELCSFPGQLRFPKAMADYDKMFQQYLGKMCPHWVGNVDCILGRVLVKMNTWKYEGESVRLDLSTAQTCMLDLFQNGKERKVWDVCENVVECAHGAELQECKSIVYGILESLMKDIPVLVRLNESQEGVLWDDDTLILNKDYKPMSAFIRLSTPTPVSPERFHGVIRDNIECIRDFFRCACEAMVMRIMKERRTMTIDELEREVFGRMEGRYDLTAMAIGFVEITSSLEKQNSVDINGSVVTYID